MAKFENSYDMNPVKSLLGDVAMWFIGLIPENVRSFILYALVNNLQKGMTHRLRQNSTIDRIPSEFFHTVDITSLSKNHNFEIGCPMAFGTWEQQVQDAILRLGKFDLFVDVGADVGLYPVAMAKNGLANECIGFERLKSSQNAMADLAIGNNVDVEIMGEFNHSSVELMRDKLEPTSRTLWMFDVEGAESSLISEEFLDLVCLQPESILIIELHPHLSGVNEYEDLLRRLHLRFEIDFIDSSERKVSSHMIEMFPDRADWELFIALSEQRQIWMQWAVCKQKTSNREG